MFRVAKGTLVRSLFGGRRPHVAAQHALQRIESVRIQTKPFPHLIVDEIFPDDFYEEILSHLPDVSSLSIPDKFGMMKIGDDDTAFRALPQASQKFWSIFETDIKTPICSALLRHYKSYLSEKLTLIFGPAPIESTVADEEFRHLRGIVQCRTTGSRMGPHVDKATSLFTFLFYFASDESLRPFGTIFYEAPNLEALTERYRANRGIRAWFPNNDDLAALNLRPAPPIEFQRNRLVSYANLPYSLHGAATDAAAVRFSMQSFCDLPLRISMPLFEGWRDPISPNGLYRGDT